MSKEKPSEETYYEKMWELLELQPHVKAMSLFIKSINFDKKIEKDSDAKIIKDLGTRADLIKEGVIKDTETINKLKREGKRDYTDEDKKEMKVKMQYAYKFIIEALKKYLDLKPEYYNIIALWIIGTYSHKEFPSYPYLFLNAMRGSGKTRLMRLIAYLSKDGDMLNSLTEAVLFRSKGMLGIDEFEGVGRKGTEALKELLNSAYKKGTKVKRMRKVKKFDGEEQVVEEFDVYRPIVMANIYGLVDEALKDRCLVLIIEKSNDKKKVNLIENFDREKIIQNAIELLNQCSLCSYLSLGEYYDNWNNFVTNNYTNNTNNINYTNYTNYTEVFKCLNLTTLNGREIELSLPLLILSDEIGTLSETVTTLTNLFEERRNDDKNDNFDISLYEMISQEIEVDNWVAIKELTIKFKDFLGNNDDWINAKWMGRALKRLNLALEKKRIANGTYVRLNYKKSKEKMGMFK